LFYLKAYEIGNQTIIRFIMGNVLKYFQSLEKLVDISLNTIHGLFACFFSTRVPGYFILSLLYVGIGFGQDEMPESTYLYDGNSLGSGTGQAAALESGERGGNKTRSADKPHSVWAPGPVYTPEGFFPAWC
jgi:hypothetical protein